MASTKGISRVKQYALDHDTNSAAEVKEVLETFLSSKKEPKSTKQQA
jgi:hypothetical protein